MSQSSYMQNNKRNKRKYDDGGFEETPTRTDKKKTKDCSKQREQKRGEFT